VSTEAKTWVHRHSLNARICHWVSVISFFYLVYSGVMIFLHFPELYWGKVGFQGYPAIFRLEDWGISWERAEELGDRRWGRSYHYLFAWVFVLNGLVYLAWNLWQKKYRSKMLPSREQLTSDHLTGEIRNKLAFRRPGTTATDKYNVLQKISYLLVLFVMFPFMIISGLAQMPAFTAIAPELIDMFGGRQTARTLHVICTILMLLFVAVHLLEIALAGAVPRIRSMITGKFEGVKTPKQGK
jgi:thiosulfate reductase cytochrome b subunit